MLRPCRRNARLILVLGLSLILGLSDNLGLSQCAWAVTFSSRYVPPEVIYADDLGQTISLPRQININTVGLNQLRILPGFDEDLALKILRSRPFKDMGDLSQKLSALVSLDRKRVERLMEQIRPKIQF